MNFKYNFSGCGVIVILLNVLFAILHKFAKEINAILGPKPVIMNISSEKMKQILA